MSSEIDFDLKSDLVIPYERDFFSVKLKSTNFIPVLINPEVIDFKSPVVPFSKYFLDKKIDGWNCFSFPFIVNLNHSDIKELEHIPRHCNKCLSYLDNEFFGGNIPQMCPFCTEYCSVNESYVWFKKECISKPLYIFVLIGSNINQATYEMIENFNERRIVCYVSNGMYVFLNNNKDNKQSHLVTFDSPLPLSIISEGYIKINKFSYENPEKSNFNTIVKDIMEMIPETNDSKHIIIFNSGPHTCIKNTDIIPQKYKKSTTISIFNQIAVRCKCFDSVNTYGGFYYYNYDRIPGIESLETILSTKVQSINQVHYDSDIRLINCDHALVTGLDSIVGSDSAIQITIETNRRIICCNLVIRPRIGYTNLLSETQLAAFILGAKENGLQKIIKSVSPKLNEVYIPYKIKNAFLFDVNFGYSYPVKLIPIVLTIRPYMYQIKPAERVIDQISFQTVSNMSILIILLHTTIIIYVGGDVTNDDWVKYIGSTPESYMLSYKVNDPNIDSPLWAKIRELKKLFNHDIPVVICPSESGTRIQLYNILNVDKSDNRSTLFTKISMIIEQAVKN